MASIELLGVAANALQLLNYASNLVKIAISLSQPLSEMPDELRSMKMTARNTEIFIKHVITSLETEGDADLRTIYKESLNLARELLEILRDVNEVAGANMWRVVRETIRFDQVERKMRQRLPDLERLQKQTNNYITMQDRYLIVHLLKPSGSESLLNLT